MQRVLFTIPIGDGFPVFGYGLFLMLGFVAGLILAGIRAKRRGVSTDATLDVGLIAIFAGVVGARITYLLLDYQPTDGDYGTAMEWLAVWEGGLTFQGGLFLALFANFLYLRWKKLSVARMFDIYAPSLALGVGFGRVGCLLNGCCWGKIAPAGSWFAMYFPEHIESMASQYHIQAASPGYWSELMTGLGYHADTMPLVPIYATQIISALGLFAIAAGIVLAERRWPGRPDGQSIVWFLFAYGVGRFLIEYWRDDTPLRYGFGVFEGLRLGQWLALAMFAAAVVLQLFLSRKKSSGEVKS